MTLSHRPHHIYRAGPRAQSSLTRLMDDARGAVYAVRIDDATIKIGYSENLAERLRHLRCGLADTSHILALRCPATYDDERAIHRRLKGIATRGREYYPASNPDVISVVNEMRKALNLDPIVAAARP